MERIKLIDSQFIGSKSFGTGNLMIGPTKFEWYRGEEDVSDIVMFSESGMKYAENYRNKIKIGFIIEPFAISPNTFSYVLQDSIKNQFDLILTYDERLLKIDPEKFKSYTFGGCWIFPNEQKIHNKNKNISIIASSKNYAPGHKLRHSSISKYSSLIEGIYGGGYLFIENKIEALKNYRFSLTIENDIQNNLFTEKIIDCFVTGTIPIYWGCPNIGDFFNTDGILIFNNELDLKKILEKCNKELYKNMLPATKENFELAKKYKIPEDYIWDKYLVKINTK